MARLTPPINTRGLFQLRSPFTTAPNIVYTVGAHYTFRDLIVRNVDPMKVVYTPRGLTEAHYQQDQLAGAIIVALLSPTQNPIYVPDTYIESYPNMGVVPHSWVVLTASLGMLQDNYDLTRARNAVATALEDDIGVMAQVLVSVAPVTEAITQEQYIQNLAARQAAVRNRSSDFADKQTLLAELERVKQQNQDLMLMVQQLTS